MSEGKSKIKHFFRKLDIFGSKIHFRVNKKLLHKSLCGGITTLLFVSVITFYVGLIFKDFVTRNNVNLIFTNKVLQTNPSVNLSSSEFNIAFGLMYQMNATYGPEIDKYFEYEMNLVEWLGAADINYHPIQMKTCEQSDFKDISKDIFELNSIGEMYCPVLNGVNFTLAGLYSDYWYQYIEISIKLKPEFLEKIAEVRESLDKNPLQATVYYKDTGIEYDNQTHPLPSLLNSQVTTVNIDNYKLAEISISDLTFESDANILINDPEVYYSTISDTYKEYVVITENREVMSAPYSLGLAKFILRASAKMYIIKRRYQKIQEFLGDMSGITSQILFILFIFFEYTNRKSAENKILSKVLKYKGKKDFDSDYLVELFSQESNIIPKIAQTECKEVKESRNISEEDNHFQSKSNSDDSSDKNNPDVFNLNQIENNIGQNKNNSSREGVTCTLTPETLKVKSAIKLPPIKNKSYVNYTNVNLTRVENISYNSNLKSNPSKEDTPIPSPNKSLENLNLRTSKVLIDKKKIGKRTTLYLINNVSSAKPLTHKEVDINKELQNKKLFNQSTLDIILIKLSAVFCCHKYKVRKEIIKNASSKVYFFLDVLTYFKKMQEIDLLKYLLLSPDKLYLFNFLSKPPISMKDVSSNVYLEYLEEQKRNMTMTRQDIKILHESYNNLLSQPQLSLEDKKLLNLIDAQVESIKQ